MIGKHWGMEKVILTVLKSAFIVECYSSMILTLLRAENESAHLMYTKLGYARLHRNSCSAVLILMLIPQVL